MLGAIIGDIVGSPYEFANTTNPRFPLFGKGCDFTDDTVCTVAVADALLSGEDFGSSLRRWCLKYPNPKGSYGGSFAAWLRSPNPQPYNSFGNGAAMRVSPCGWFSDTAFGTLRAAIASANPTHNHPEGLLGATVVALAIFRLRTMSCPSFSSPQILGLVSEAYGEDWEQNLPPRGVFDETCQGCVPLAFHICKKASGFVSALRMAVVYGGDSDTLAAIVGSLAEARWGIPEDVKAQALAFLPAEMRSVIDEFSNRFGYGL